VRRVRSRLRRTVMPYGVTSVREDLPVPARLLVLVCVAASGAPANRLTPWVARRSIPSGASLSPCPPTQQ